MSLRVQIDQEYAPTHLGKRHGQVNGCRGLATSPFLVHNCNRLHDPTRAYRTRRGPAPVRPMETSLFTWTTRYPSHREKDRPTESQSPQFRIRCHPARNPGPSAATTESPRESWPQTEAKGTGTYDSGTYRKEAKEGRLELHAKANITTPAHPCRPTRPTQPRRCFVILTWMAAKKPDPKKQNLASEEGDEKLVIGLRKRLKFLRNT